MNEMITSIEELDSEYTQRVVRETLELSKNKIKFLSYSHSNTTDGGVHVFYYGIISRHDNPLTNEAWKTLKEYFEQDDDSQPFGLCRMYFSNIWHIVPYDE